MRSIVPISCIVAALCACHATPHTYTSSNYVVVMPNPLVETRAGERYVQPVEVRSTTASPIAAQLLLFDDTIADLSPEDEPTLAEVQRRLESSGDELVFPELAIPPHAERPVLELRLSAPGWKQPATIRKLL